MGNQHPPVGDADREKLRSLHAQGLGRNEIARRMNRGKSTISHLAAEMGLSFDREATKVATEARVLDAKARRTKLALDLLTDAEELRRQMWAPAAIHNFGGRDNTYNSHDLEKPVFRDQRDIIQATAIAVDKHLALIKHDSDPGVDTARSVIGELGRALIMAADALDDDSTS